MFRIFSDLGGLVTQAVPAWALPFVLMGAALVALPLWMESVRNKQIKGALRRMLRAEGAERAQLADRALSLAGARRGRLITLIQEAIRYNLPAMRDAGLERLGAIPKAAEHVRALRRRTVREQRALRDPLEAVVRIEALLGEGLTVAAEEELGRALGAFPGDTELQRLRIEVSPPGSP